MPVLLAKVLPYIIAAVVAFGLYEGWAYHERTLGAAEVNTSNLEALAAQNLKDAATNKKIAIELQAKLTKLQSVAQAAGTKIDADPVEPGSQADIDAAAAVNCMLDETTCGK